ncbi:flippase [Klebsiella quasipneumoniae]|uniref:flippase n=1 Tax=Klebsiella quasipneumoniae TaxID=1463165 RepID=UPI0008E386BD|nr:flippase [Klebsiella quasipneumoniae]MCS5747593.1 flippase [Klebsiella quasipneumoniae subsp. quasipneumoniae]SFG70227.1 Membrane protein involved in the export of O-antigen and teichoic acid [Klebsiella quasipneumoniae]SFX50927.1 Membrane protein involved in the export of O-antigen and teichoic acid [Klebsiella quasipneumoniae]SFX99452.1 Membrane protein involved in the export of O-antigen and teichoic acid [Klebsiella quasipneumoniae]SMC48131.1 Membrane protein involved in the export of O
MLKIKAKSLSSIFKNRNEAFYNSLWLLSERVITILFTFTVGIFLARYLGPNDFGVYNYLISIITLLTPLTALGLNAVVVRDLVDAQREEQNDTNVILGTSCILRFFGGVFACVSLLLVDIYFNISQHNTLWLVLLATANIFSCFQVVDFWLQSKVNSKYSAILRLSIFIISAIVKLISIIVFSCGLKTILVIQTFEVLASGLLYVPLYKYLNGKIFSWTYNKNKAKTLMSKSWWLILSGVAEVLYLKIDQIMLGMINGYSTVATYAVAARLSEAWYFFPTIITASFFPLLILAKKESEEKYKRKLLDLSRKLFFCALLISIFITLIAHTAINILYGQAYAESATILIIHIWASLFVFMRAVLSKWLVIENMLPFSLVTHISGAIVNIILNLILIPKMGGIGSAIATVISYSISSYFSLFIFKRTRVMGWIMTKAIFTCFLIFRGKNETIHK